MHALVVPLEVPKVDHDGLLRTRCSGPSKRYQGSVDRESNEEILTKPSRFLCCNDSIFGALV